MKINVKNTPFSYKQVLSLATIFVVVLALLKLASLSIFLVAALFVYTLSTNKIEYVFGVLIMLVAACSINKVIINQDTAFLLVVRGSIFLLAVILTVKSFANKNAWFLSPFYWLIAYIVYMMIVSLVGWAPLISELKAILFLGFLIAFIYMVSTAYADNVDVSYIRGVMLVVAGFFILGSIAVIPFPGIGRSMMYIKMEGYGMEFHAEDLGSKNLFNGMTWHSQCLGPLIAVLNAYLLSDYLTGFKKPCWLYRILLLASPVLIYLTSSRTALLGYVISIMVCVFFSLQSRGISAAKKNKILTGFIAIVVVGCIFAMISPSARSSVKLFMLKTSEGSLVGESVSEQLIDSRQELVERGLENFKESPLIGNGFQVAKDMMGISVERGGFILSAPIEKGVLPVMVLEEGGLFGFIIFAIFILSVFLRYLKLGLVCFLSTFTTFIALNTGEATFFSTSGAGGLLWGICFAGLIIDVDRHRRFLEQQRLRLFSQQS